jgi:hypothetical protein
MVTKLAFMQTCNAAKQSSCNDSVFYNKIQQNYVG